MTGYAIGDAISPGYINLYPALAPQCKVTYGEKLSGAGYSEHAIIVNQTIGQNFTVAGYVSETGKAYFHFYTKSGSPVTSLDITPPTGWVFVGAFASRYAILGNLNDSTANNWGAAIMVRDEALGPNELALADHNHDTLYSKLDAFNALKTTVGNKLDSSAISNYNTNAKLDDKFDTKVDASDFGTISYSGLDSGDASVYPTSYRKGGTPALPKPTKAGSEFVGWTWGGQDTPTTDREAIKNAFAPGGAITLTANWGAPSANYFFTEDAPCRAGSGEQTHTIAVKLASEQKTLSGITFAKKDAAPLGSSADGIRFQVGDATPVGWDTSTGSVTLTQLGEGSYGVYVKVTVPAGAIDQSKVVPSYADSSYVSSFAKLSYTFA